MMNLTDVTIAIKDGYQITKDEAREICKIPLEELMLKADEIRAHFCGNNFDMCTIINGKSGKCSEDCKYCAQSHFYHTEINSYPLLSEKEFMSDALSNFQQGVLRYSIVTSGKKLNKVDLQKLITIYQSINEQCKIKLCASLGLLSYEELVMLRNSGVTRYHNNLETSRRYFPFICSTHAYDEKIKTIKMAQKAGLEVCSGGIIGLGETDEDRLDLAFALRELGIKSIPLNLLNPIKGTPLENQEPIGEEEFLKVVALFRFINPQAVIRLAGGRSLLVNFGEKAFMTGVNGTITGNLLTTYGNSTKKDLALIKSLGYEVS